MGLARRCNPYWQCTHLHIRAEGKCKADGAPAVRAVCPNSLEHSRILSKFAQTAFVMLVDAFWSRRRCVPSKSSRTHCRAENSWTPATPKMRYKPSSTILRPSTPPTSETPSQPAQTTYGHILKHILKCVWEYARAELTSLHRHLPGILRGTYSNGQR